MSKTFLMMFLIFSLVVISCGSDKEVSETDQDFGGTIHADETEKPASDSDAVISTEDKDTPLPDKVALDEIVADADEVIIDEIVADADEAAADETASDADTVVADETASDADAVVADETVSDADAVVADETVSDADEVVADETASDADAVVADETVADADEAAADEDEDSELQDEDTPSLCTGISLGTVEIDNSGFYYSSYTPDTGDSTNGAVEDMFSMEFYNSGLAVGTYDLSLDGNENYSSCDQCLRIYEDITGGNVAKEYFQESGVLEITTVGEFGTSAGTITSAKLVEVTIGSQADGFPSTPVENGDCIEIATAAWDNLYEDPCQPVNPCTEANKTVCTDYDGDEVADCGCDQGYHDENGTCVEGVVCTGISIDIMAASTQYPNSFNGLFTPNTGNPNLPDMMNLSFYGTIPSVGDISLGTNPNDNYSSCTTCILAYEDIEGSGSAKTFFQRAGTLNVQSVTDDGANHITSIEGTMTDIVLEEVTIDATTTVSTPVPNGSCLEISTYVYSVSTN